MKISIAKPLSLSLGLSLGLASIMLGQTTFQIVPGNPQNGGDGESLPPYGANITPPGGSTFTSALVFCDDFSDQVNWDQSWLTLTTSVSSFFPQPQSNAVSDVYYSGGETAGATQSQEYIAAAILAVDIAANPSANQVVDGFAMWDIFQPGNISNDAASLSNPTLAQIQTAAETALSTALTYTTYGQFESAMDTTLNLAQGTSVNVTVYTPEYQGSVYQEPSTSSDPIPNGAPSGTRPQEFLVVSVPEPSTLAFLGFDFIGTAAAGMYFVRRKSRVRS